MEKNIISLENCRRQSLNSYMLPLYTTIETHQNLLSEENTLLYQLYYAFFLMRLREYRGVSFQKLSEKSGIHYLSLMEFESGKYPLPSELINAYLSLLKGKIEFQRLEEKILSQRLYRVRTNCF